jgi:hypothetical protein
MSAPPRLRELTIAELSRMARSFDALDDAEGGRRWPASRFVECVRLELASAPHRIEPAGRPNGKG